MRNKCNILLSCTGCIVRNYFQHPRYVVQLAYDMGDYLTIGIVIHIHLDTFEKEECREEIVIQKIEIPSKNTP